MPKPKRGEIFLLKFDKYILCEVMGEEQERDYENYVLYEFQYWDNDHDDYIVGWLREDAINKGKRLLKKYLKDRK